MASPPRGKRLPAEERRRQVVEAARAILITDGYDAVTLRAVAGRCGLSVAGIQHLFGDKANLVAAMIEGIGAEYDAVYDELAATGNGDDRLRSFESYILTEDIAKEETAGLFFELWRLAHREPAAAKAVSELYANQLDRMVNLVLQTNPALGVREAAARAAIIMASHDGFMNTIGYGKTRPQALRDVSDEDLVEALAAIAAGPPSRALPALATDTVERRG